MNDIGGKNYKHVISLGYFCSVALELEKIGLRNASYPFDWCISDLAGIFEAIENDFSEYLDLKCMSQYKPCMHIFRNDKYNIEFYHDFSAYQPLENQISFVREKYNRRIARFYHDIKEPTLFVRYIDDKKDDNGYFKELKWIEENKNKIDKLLKSFCENNEIIYIGNSCLTSEVIDIFTVEKDANDSVAREPLEKNKELKCFLESINCQNKENNIEIYKKKKAKEQRLYKRIKKKMEQKFVYKIRKKYVWIKQYE